MRVRACEGVCEKVCVLSVVCCVLCVVCCVCVCVCAHPHGHRYRAGQWTQDDVIFTGRLRLRALPTDDLAVAPSRLGAYA